METPEVLISPAECDFMCQFEWFELSSNIFSVSVYTPSLVVGGVIYLVYRAVKRSRNKKI